MGVTVPTSASNPNVATAAPPPTTQTQPTVTQYPSNAHAAPNLPNPHLHASSAITNSNPRNTPPRPRGRGRPPRARGRQARSNPTARTAYNSNLPNSANTSTTVAAATQPVGMMTPEALLTLQRQHQHQALLNRQQQQQALASRQQQQQAMVNRQQQQAMVNRQQQQQAMINRHQQQHVMANRQQQRQALARQQHQAMMRRQAANTGLTYPSGQQQPTTSSAQIYQASQPSSNPQTNTQQSRKVVPSSAVRQKLIAFHSKYKDTFNKLSPHLPVYLNAHSEGRRDVVKKQLFGVNLILKFASEPAIPEVVTSQLIDQHATVIDRLISYFKSYFRQRSQGANPANNPSRTTAVRTVSDPNVTQQRLLQAQNSTRMRLQQPTQAHAQTQARQQSGTRTQIGANHQVPVQPQLQISRGTGPPNPLVTNSATNVQLAVRPNPAVSQPALQKELSIANRKGAHVGVKKPTSTGSHASIAAKKAKILNTIQVQAETILKRAEIAMRNVEKFVTIKSKEDKAARIERVRNTLQALQRMVKVKKMSAEKNTFIFSSEGGMEVAKEKEPDRQSFRGMIEEDCRAAKARSTLLDLEISEEFGCAVIACQLLIEEVRLPKLILHVKKGYPKFGTVTYAFERPPMGWVGVVAEVHNQFKLEMTQIINNDSSIGVASLLDIWARVAKEIFGKM